jgi:hypothetical protein
VTNVVNRVRAPIDRALDRVVDWIVAQARRLGRLLGAGRGRGPGDAGGEIDAPRTMVAAQQGQFSSVPASLLRQIAAARSGTAIFTGPGGSPKEVTTRLIAAHPDARFDSRSKQLTLPPVDAGSVAQAGTLQALGAAIAAKTGVSKVKIKKADQDAPAREVPIVLVRGGGGPSRPPPPAKNITVEFEAEINPIANVMRGQLTATGDLVDPQYIPTLVTAERPGGAGLTLKITPAQWNGHILPRHVLATLDRGDTRVRTVWLGTPDSYAAMMEEATNNQAVRNVVKPGAKGMHNIVLTMRGQTFNLKVNLDTGEIESFHPTGGDTAQFARLPWTDASGALMWTARPRRR